MKQLVKLVVLVIMLFSFSLYAQSPTVSSIKDQLGHLDGQVKSLIANKNEIANKLNVLAEKIKDAKSDSSSKILPQLALQNMLQESQTLSDALLEINRKIKSKKETRRSLLTQLVQAYDIAIKLTARKITKTKGNQQKELIAHLNQLRTERHLVRKQFAPDHRSQPPLDHEDLLKSEDPEELIERADAVKDEQDKLRRRLQAIDKRVAELAAESRLKRQLGNFLDDQTLFGEESRTLQFSRDNPAAALAAENKNSNDEHRVGEQATEDQEGMLGDFTSDADPAPPEPDDGYSEPVNGGGGSYFDFGAGDTQIERGDLPVVIEADYSDLSGMSSEKQSKVLGKHRAKLVEEIKRLQIVYDRIHEKAEQLE
jgi:uncharacterized protein YoxC